MKKPPNASSERAGIPGLDIFKIAGQSISGYVPGLKIRSQREIRCPYTSIPEQMLALYLEYHPHVSFYQRACFTRSLFVVENEKEKQERLSKRRQ